MKAASGTKHEIDSLFLNLSLIEFDLVIDSLRLIQNFIE